MFHAIKLQWLAMCDSHTYVTILLSDSLSMPLTLSSINLATWRYKHEKHALFDESNCMYMSDFATLIQNVSDLLVLAKLARSAPTSV